MTRGIAIFSLLLAASSLTACGDDEGRSGSVGTTEPTASESVTEEPADGDDGRPVLELHDAGAEPRTLLGLEVAEGDTEHATMTMTMGMQLSIDGRRQNAPEAPPMTMGMLVEVTDVADNGDVTTEFRYDEVGVEGSGPLARQMETALAPMEDVEGTLRVTGTGGFIDSEFDLPSDMPPMMASTMNSFESQLANLCPPLPEEPVGVGASWTVHTQAEVNGIEAETVYDYTVVELTEDSIVLDVSYSQTAGEQDVEAPGLPAGSTLQLESMETSGAGQVAIEPGRMFPALSDMEGGGTIRMTAEEGGQDIVMVQELDVAVQIRAD